ncbi:troponin C, isoallergen Bla g 6.0101-like isoform X1 [Bradysia coprophila]|uniref:troponin C, isoallergen Bla g 6.0101-like isoform X1 n=2 Tax=Bradysia coprophila TaxID=38358 RepID=UPI00187D7281|nr:troponin C, isoallergen Bla g 6.0101-like isoform X1 [Bradysia coprophila]
MVQFSELDKETVRILKNAFLAFENEKSGTILAEDIGTIVEMLGHRLDERALKLAIKEADPVGSGKVEFEPFACFASKYVEVEEDADAVAKELREAFLLYDRDSKGYITVEVLRQILHEIDDKIPPGDLDLMIEEIDADGSGTVDFEEFMEVMTGPI